MATRYVVPLREGGSLPAIVEADDLGLYVVKFRGAGQGILALIAELLAGEIGRALGLRVPEIVFMEIDAALGRNEPDYEIRQLLKASPGSILHSTTSPARPCSIRRRATKPRPTKPRCSSGSTPSRRTSTARRVMRICWCGIASSIPSTMAPPCSSITTGRRMEKKITVALRRRSSSIFCCPGQRRFHPRLRLARERLTEASLPRS